MKLRPQSQGHGHKRALFLGAFGFVAFCLALTGVLQYWLQAAGAGFSNAPSNPVVRTSQLRIAGTTGANQILVTQTGFVPTVLTTTVGSQVTWRNATESLQILRSDSPQRVYLPLVGREGDRNAATGDIEPASSPVSPAGDGLFTASLPPGASFSFVFTATGTFPFYLATAPAFAGRIAVVSELPLATSTPTATPTHTPTATPTATPTQTGEQPPPDPGTVAPPLAQTGGTSLLDATDFLYTGANPIQTGVVSGTIEFLRTAVLRGKVTTRDGAALPGVRITVLGHPEFGQTLTRADGMFDMAVNGGGQLAVRYEKDGFLTVQRAVVAPWRDYVWLPEVIMIPLDSVVTPIELGAATLQVARGSVVTDTDGARQATILFPQGTTATMVLPDGTTSPLTTVNVRITEYTIGDSGPVAMPAALPPSSGYTYAAEFSVDEAMAAGAAEVRFSQPLPVYVENFLDFPVGGAVPAGYYDRQRGQWVASANGRVIRVLGVTGGLADLDLEGNGVAADAAALAALGVTNAERMRLAQLYTAGQSLWRVPFSHFSPFDLNWPMGPPDDAVRPPGDDDHDHNPDEVTCQGGSIIGCESQMLGESLPIAGTRWQLYYRSDRTPGRKDATLVIPVSGATIPASLAAMHVEVTIAGHHYWQSFAPAPNRTYTVTWDGKDGYGRVVQGAQPAVISVHFDYRPQYYAALTDRINSFGRAEAIGAAVLGSRVAAIFRYTRSWTRLVSYRYLPALGLGGWSLSIQHTYDPVERTLFYGDGGQRRGEALETTINTVAGNGAAGFSGDGGPAAIASLSFPRGITLGPDGSLYVADAGNNRIRRVTDGVITTVAGVGTRGFSGDGGLAVVAELNGPRGVAVGPDGSLYIADSGNLRVRRVRPDGVITTVAGGRQSGPLAEGVPAVEVFLGNPDNVDVGPDGSLYIATPGHFHVVRRVGTDGIITTVAGDGTGIPGFSGDGGPATAARFYSPYDVAVGPDGSLYIADWGNSRIRRVGSDGIITTVAGKGSATWVGGFSGDGGPAVAAELSVPVGIAIDSDGSLYIVDYGNSRIRRVGPDGIITTVAGGGNPPSGNGEGASPMAANLSPLQIAIGADHTLYITEFSHRVRHTRSDLPDVDVTGMLLPSEDGSEVYVFDKGGRHLRTLAALTGALRYEFGYDGNGYLTAVTDGDGNVTTFERAGATPVAIVAPGGQRTTLGVDSNGWLARATDPAGATHTMSYSADGLLTQFVDPRANVHTFTYDGRGRLIKDEDPAGGSTTLARVATRNIYTVTTTSALGRNRQYSVETVPTGAIRRGVTQPNGAKTTMLLDADGSEQITYADGTLVTVHYGPDPRWGMLAPVATRMQVQTPGGHTRTITTQRSVELATPNNMFSLIWMTDTITDSGRIHTRVYSAASRTFTDTTPMGRQRIKTLDDRGRVVALAAGGLHPVQWGYDDQGRIISMSQGDRVTTLAYNTAGLVSQLTGPLAHTVAFTYDAVGRVTQVARPDSEFIKFAYDVNGNMIALTPPDAAAHTFSYTPVDRLQGYAPPALPGGQTQLQFAYNADRQLTQMTRGATAVTLAYDAAGRLQSIASPQETVQATYDAASRLDTLATASGIGLAYDYDGPLRTSTSWSGPVVGAVQRAYNNNLELTGRTINGASAQAFVYDADGMLVQAGALTLQRSLANGLLTGTVLGVVSDTRSFNSYAEWTSYHAAAGAAALFSTQYTRDRVGRVTQLNEIVGGVATTYTYSYDLVGRLVEVKQNGVTASTYDYDANGNRLAQTAAGNETDGSYDAQDRLIQYGAKTYAYTANGDLASVSVGGQTTNYTYDVLGNLRNVTLPGGKQLTYLIDGRNRRIGKQVNGVQVQGFLYQSRLKPIAELDGNNAVISTFVYGSRPNVPDYMVKGGVTYRIIVDHLGSPRLVVHSATGTIVQRLDYDEFGNVRLDTNPGFQPFGFAGGLYDRDTGLVRYGARDYDPGIGRWTSKDADGLAGGINLYLYAYGDPVNFLDLNGRSPAPAVAGTFGAAASGAAASGGAAFGLGSTSAFIAAALILGVPVAAGILATAALFDSAQLNRDETGDDEGPNEGGAPPQDGEVDGGSSCPTPLIPQSDTDKAPPPSDEVTDDFLRNPTFPKRGPTPRIPYPETPENGFDDPSLDAPFRL